jgi:hypothetical protein
MTEIDAIKNMGSEQIIRAYKYSSDNQRQVIRQKIKTRGKSRSNLALLCSFDLVDKEPDERNVNGPSRTIIGEK